MELELDELRIILLKERESGKLTQIPPDLYQNASASLAELIKTLYASEDRFFSVQAQLTMEEVNSIRETIQDIFRMRAEKILLLANAEAEGETAARDEVKKMLVSERQMYREITESVQACRRELLDAASDPEALSSGHSGSDAMTDEGPGSLSGVTEDRPSLVLARILEDVEPFMAVDGRVYNLLKEDLVTLPEQNAEVLRERNILLSIGLHK
jgi:DNA replication factor GINS